jgi:sigma-B regulation protein RsbU (phosphoserine phosphatase)
MSAALAQDGGTEELTEAALSQHLFTPEQIRQRHLDSLLTQDSVTEDRFDRISHLAKTIFGVTMSSVTLLDGERAYLKSAMGLEQHGDALVQALLPLFQDGTGAILIPDATADARLAQLPVVTGAPYLRFYAGMPLVDDDGIGLGTFCLYDTVPRGLDRTQWATFAELASWVRRELVDSEEMSRARRVQESLLPRSAPSLPGYQVAGLCQPTKSVGGDFYDYAMVSGRLIFSLVDVMGKGAGAALVAATVRALLHASMSEVALGVGGRPAKDERRPFRGGISGVVADIDRLARQDLESTDTLVTGFFCDVDPDTGVTRYADAGHGLSLVMRACGQAVWLRSDDMPVGVESVGAWSQQEITIEPGDTLLSVSDGLFDLLGGAEPAFDAIAQLARQNPLADDLIAAISRLTALGTPVDDVTAVAVHREKPAAERGPGELILSEAQRKVVTP